MAKIKLYHQGQLLSELGLDPGQEYFAGRSSQCQLVLEHDRGISRQHIRLAQEGDVWVVTLLSKFGGLIYAGQSVDQIRLDSDTRFTIQPYEFEFIFAEAVEEAAPEPVEALETEIPPENEIENVLEPESAPTEVIATPPDVEMPFSENTSSGTPDATQVVSSPIVPFLRVFNRANGHEEILKLEGETWTAGRHPDSEIYINDNSISRKHFEITRSSSGYFVCDQNSSNGTTLNGELLPPGEKHKLMSGDVITIRNIQITFEVHDTAFNDRIRNLPSVIDSDDGVEDYVEEADSAGPAVIRLPPSGKSSWEQNKLRIALGALVLVTLVGYFFTDDSEPQNSDTAAMTEGGTELGSRKEISPQKMKELEAKYELAQKNYERGNYNFCKDILTEIHLEVPNIGDSQNLLKFCEQAIDLSLINKERELKEQKKAEAEAKISSIVANCQSLYNETMTAEKMQECLAEAMELDPQNAGATELLERIRIRDEEKKNAAIQQREIAVATNNGKAHYKRAADYESKGMLKKAITEYKSFLARNYPNVQTQEESARRSIATLQQNLNQKIADRIASCRQFIEKSDFKAARKACDEVLKDEPGNKDAKELKERAQNEMSRGLKSVYEDSVLEESIGNIEAAKEKWKNIMNGSYSGENYYEKAKSKLKKYGG